MSHHKLEVADIFRRHGDAWHQTYAKHISLGQLRVMSAIKDCRTAALGGHAERCVDCAHTRIAYNSCRNRHCPKCQWSAAESWLEARKNELLPAPYFHVVFTLPSQIGAIAYQNKRTVYGILFKAASKALCTIAGDPKHLGAKIGVTSVLHTWGQNLQHHPHVHCIVPGGGISLDGNSWISCKPIFFLPVRVLSRLFRRLFLQLLASAYDASELSFFNNLSALTDRKTFNAYLAPLRKTEWVVYAKQPFTGPKQVLGYLARYTHRVAIANSRLVKMEDANVTMRWKDYRRKGNNQNRFMTLSAGEFMRRFLLHVLPDGFHRIRHHGLFANAYRANMIKICRELLDIPKEIPESESRTSDDNPMIDNQTNCPCCGGRMVIIEIFEHPFAHSKQHHRSRKLDGL